MPTYPWRQEHLGWCRKTWHMAFKPQDPGQGSAHLLLMQARWDGHSLLTRHSGRQFGGGPRRSGKQVQLAVRSGVTVHLEFGPQGEGLHGSFGLGCGTGSPKDGEENFRNNCLDQDLIVSYPWWKCFLGFRKCFVNCSEFIHKFSVFLEFLRALGHWRKMGDGKFYL